MQSQSIVNARVSHYDLHTHSTWSDGVLPPSEVIERAKKRGVSVLALTDHDEVGGLGEARAAAADAGVELIAGVEVSVSWSSHTIHVVGLRIDPSNPQLIAGLLANRSGRNARAQKIGAELERAGVPDALHGARAYVTNPELVSRTHFARYLVASGHAKNIQAVFDRYLGTGKPGYVPHAWASLQEAVEWISAAGGLPVLAHPGRYKLSVEEQGRLLGRFKDAGGAAIEVVTGSHAPDQYAYWARRSREFGLLASTGSDFHGLPDSYRDLGDLPELPSGCKPVWHAF